MTDYKRDNEARPACRYGRVYFNLRRQFQLTASEALLTDVVDTLSRRTGWSFASKRYLASTLGVSERSITRMIDKLKERGLVEQKCGRRGLELRASESWQAARGVDAPANSSQST